MLNYVERGQGPALLFVHAFPLDHVMWSQQAKVFSSNRRVITPDVVGFGGSLPPRPWTMAEIVEELEELVSALEIDQLELVGLSMGGYIALNYALKYRQRISKLTLAHTRARADNDAEKQKRTDMIAALQRDGIQMLPDAMLPRLLKPNPSPEIVAQVRAKILATDPAAAAYAVAAMRDRPDGTPFLSTLTCPTLVLAGEGDAVFKVEDCREIAAALPNGRFACIRDAGHLSNLENPEAFNKTLEEFLA